MNLTYNEQLLDQLGKCSAVIATAMLAQPFNVAAFTKATHEYNSLYNAVLERMRTDDQ